ncbi:MAG: MlaD family protein [Pseudomonadota bacterium]
METRANFALIGALVIVSVLAFAGFTLWLGQSQFNRDFDTYEIVFEGPVTLETGASVRFNGISVGEVTRVAIDRSDDSLVRTRVRVNSDTPVRTDSVAAIDFAGITGLTFVQIRAGSEGAALLERRPGEPLPVIRSELNPLSEIFAGGAKILETANDSLEQVSAVLSDENVTALSNTLANFDTFSGGLADNDGLVKDVSATLLSLREASDAFAEASRSITRLSNHADNTLVSISDDVELIVTDLKSAIESANGLIETTDGAVVSADRMIQGPTTEALQEFRLASQELRLLIQRLDSVARELEQNPQIIVTGDPKPYEEGRP